MIKISLDKLTPTKIQMKKLTPHDLIFFLLAGLSVHQESALAIDNIPTYIWHGGTTFINEPVGCGFTSMSYKGLDPKVIADKTCADYQKHQECAGSIVWGTRRDFPPSIFISVNMIPGTPSPGYKFKCSGVNPSQTGAYIGYITSIAKSPKNEGGSCLAIGNPINPSVGNKYEEQNLYGGIARNLSFNITYNSIFDTDKKMLGIGWSSPYDRFISTSIFNETGLVSLRRQDGSGFSLQNTNGSLLASSDKTYGLTRLVDGLGQTSGWSFYNDKNGETEIYDANGLLVSIADRAGVTQTLSYDVSNKLNGVTDSFGRILSFTYDASSRLSMMTNPQGGIYSYTYDSNSNLSSVTYPDNKTKIFHYENVSYKNALTGITDENNSRFSTYAYDTMGRANSTEHAGAVQKSTLVYTANGIGEDNPVNTKVTDPRGSVRTYNFTTILGVVKSTGQSQPAGSGCAASAAALTYDVNGNVASRTDFNLNKTTYAYDMSRNLETSRTEGLTTANALTTATRTITTSWHPTWRLPLVVTEYSGGTANLSNGSDAPTGTALRITTNTYDTKGNITSVTEADPVRSLSRTTTTTYTYSTTVPGLILTKVVDGPRTDVSDITTYTYYPHDATCTASSATPIIDPITSTSPPNLGCRGQLQSITNALNQTTSYNRYNHHGQVEQMTDANGLVTTNTYDLRQRLLTRTVGTETTSLIYDGVGQVTQLTMPDNSQLNYTYDAAHRLTDVQDNLGNKVHYTLDTEGNRLNESTTDPANQLTKTLSRSYDALNRLQQVTGLE